MDAENEPQVRPAPRGPSLAHIADRVVGRPLLLHPTKAEVLLHVLHGRLPIDGGGGDLVPLGPDASRFIGSNRRADESYRINRAYGGVAIITIVGSLVNRGAWIGTNSGLVSYEGISAQLRDAASDPEVHSVVLDLDSPGGEATGMFALAAQVRELAKTKRVVAFVNDMAASAAYGIASAASEIVVSPTSIVGSIGVVLTHLDRSGELEQKGIKPTLIYAGKNKVDGNPFGPLSAEVQADLQAEVAKFYDQFVSLVAQGRGGRLTEEQARATEARTFLGEEAIKRGLADRIASLDAVLLSLQSIAPAGASSNRNGNMNMSTQNENAPAAISQADHTAAVDKARAEGHAAGAAEATTRIGAILNCDAAKTRPTLARSLAFDTDMGAEAAEKVLGNAAEEAPKAEAPQGNGKTEIEHRAEGLAEFGADEGKAPSKSEKAAQGWAKAVASANQMIGAA